VKECAPLIVSRSLIVKLDGSWILHVHQHKVDPKTIPVLSEFQLCLNSETALSLLEKVCHLHTCIGNADSKFTELGKSKKDNQFTSAKGAVVAFLDAGFAIHCASESSSCTVRHVNCHLLTNAESKQCALHRNTLFSLASGVSKKTVSTSKKTNYQLVILWFFFNFYFFEVYENT
jgi:hypothetical protein